MRLLLVRHAATSATRTSSFPADEPLDARGLAAAASLAARLPSRCAVVSSPARRCLQTAAAAGLALPVPEPAIAECDFGTWAGRSLADVHETDAAAVVEWMTEPSSRPHGGESLTAFCARVGAWLNAQASREGCCVAITHGGVVKAAVVRALGAPAEAFWRIDAQPLAITELHAHDGRWTVTRVNCLAGGRLAGHAGEGTAVAHGARS
jgi:broad specificity phosphatase PhoE